MKWRKSAIQLQAELEQKKRRVSQINKLLLQYTIEKMETLERIVKLKKKIEKRKQPK